MTKFTVKLAYTRHMEFEVDAETPFAAYSAARSAFEYGDRTPSDDWCDAVELEGVKHGDRELEIDTRFDFNAPKDDRGMTPVITVARDADTMRKLDEDRDAEALLNRLFTAQSVALTPEQLAEVEHWSKTPFAHDQPPAATS